jgi:hypothetical protein
MGVSNSSFLLKKLVKGALRSNDKDIPAPFKAVPETSQRMDAIRNRGSKAQEPADSNAATDQKLSKSS